MVARLGLLPWRSEDPCWTLAGRISPIQSSFISLQSITFLHSSLFSKMSADVCASCHEPLLLEIETDSDAEEQDAPSSSTPGSIPDDVELRCGCHYHW
jgi:hypothetical protein